MNASVDYKKLFEFSADISQSFILCNNNVEFRLRCLKLLQKHYGYHIMSFNLYETSIKTPSEYKMPNLDNVTVGLSKELITEYYCKYQKQDFIAIYAHQRDIRDIYRISDLISYEEYESSNFYRNLYKKYGLYYQVAMGILRAQEGIGSLSILRRKSEGDFSDNEICFFYSLRDLISRYIVNYLQIEILKLENFALKTYTGIFPIGHIIINEKYQVTYANPTGIEFITHLTGMPLDQFKYYYINKILPQLEMTADGESADTSLELPNYYLFIKRDQIEPHTAGKTKQNIITIFIQKKVVGNIYTSSETPLVKELTTREIEIIDHIRQGLKNAEIAKAMQLSEHTVKAHIQRIYSKAGVNSKTALLHKLAEAMD